MIALYVDDMLVSGPSEKDVIKTQTILLKEFKKDLGVPKKFLI